MLPNIETLFAGDRKDSFHCAPQVALAGSPPGFKELGSAAARKFAVIFSAKARKGAADMVFFDVFKEFKEKARWAGRLSVSFDVYWSMHKRYCPEIASANRLAKIPMSLD
jgi:hypothetical protein